MSTTHHRADGKSETAERPEQGHWLGGVREGYADLGEVQLHYVEAGDGPLVILLHGFPEFWYGWRLQIKALAAAGFRVVAPDMRGYNLSSRPEGVDHYDIARLAGDVRDLASSGSRGTSSSSHCRTCPRPSYTPTTGTSSGTSFTMPARRTRRRKWTATSKRGHSRARPAG
jgi:ribosomal protein L37E